MIKLEIDRNCSKLEHMTVLEIIAERALGTKTMADNPVLRNAFRRIDSLARGGNPSEDERARIASLVELCSAYESESDDGERANILRTLEELSEEQPLELSTETIEQWEDRLASSHQAFAKAKDTLDPTRPSSSGS